MTTIILAKKEDGYIIYGDTRYCTGYIPTGKTSKISNFRGKALIGGGGYAGIVNIIFEMALCKLDQENKTFTLENILVALHHIRETYPYFLCFQEDKDGEQSNDSECLLATEEGIMNFVISNGKFQGFNVADNFTAIGTGEEYALLLNRAGIQDISRIYELISEMDAGTSKEFESLELTI